MIMETSTIVTVEELEQFAIDSTRHLGYVGPKDKQLEVIVSFLQGMTTFVALVRSISASSHTLATIAT